MDNEDAKSSNSSPGGDSLEQKHSRLLAEYAKVRSQLNVLKNAVLEEKNTSAELKNHLRSRDQAIRRLEQETESLRFCNGQMQSKLVVLQKDLKDRETKPKNKKKDAVVNDVPSTSAAELNADFVQLIEVNAHLSSKLNSVQTELEGRIEGLEKELREAQLTAINAVDRLTENKKQYDALEKRLRTEIEASWRKEVSELKTKLFDASNEISQLKTDLEMSRSSEDGLKKIQVDTAQQSELLRSLRQQIDSQADQLVKLQQEKEKWLLEVQILKYKSSQSSMTNGDHDSLSTPAADSCDSLQTSSISLSPVRDQLQGRLNKLISDLQYADGKAAYFQAECSSLHLRQQMADETKHRVDQCLLDAQNHINDLKKQLETTVIQTNEQMSLMSEHIATMNEKLQLKADEILALQYELQQRPAVSVPIQQRPPPDQTKKGRR